MPVNPASKPEHIKSPIERANDVNDPNFTNDQGYYPYDLTHSESLTPLFGKITPTLNMITAPGDRHVITPNCKTLLNRIPGNFMSTINQYLDTYYIPFRAVFPNNYEKLIPNPTKGDDLPNSALPSVDFSLFVKSYLYSDFSIYITDHEVNVSTGSIFDNLDYYDAPVEFQFAIGRLTTLAYMFSRGQLLDYLGLCFDLQESDQYGNSIFQIQIDNFFNDLKNAVRSLHHAYFDDNELIVSDSRLYDISNVSLFRASLDYVVSHGYFPYFSFDSTNVDALSSLSSSAYKLIDTINSIFATPNTVVSTATYISQLNSADDPFNNGSLYLNLGLPLAYQLCVSQYFTNDSVDNIFNADLYMQNLRSVMYPPQGIYTKEPVFSYNGVSTEYDYISAAGFYNAVIDPLEGLFDRQMKLISVLLVLRNSLRFGDKFSTGRPDMLAVGDLSVPVLQDGSTSFISPIDVTQNLLKQRFLNAANYIGSGFLPYYNSIYGVTPSDTGTFPRYISHYKEELENTVTTNTAELQGEQTTNLVGFTGGRTSADVFIDDFGFIIQMISYDVLPIYTSGIDSSYHLYDRFDFFNPMLQNIGDEPIRLSDFVGNPALVNSTFGYTMRNSTYKYKVSRAHGAFCNNDLRGYLMRYPYRNFIIDQDLGENSLQLRISSDFIRDKSFYLDSVIPQLSGSSPAQYFHFVVHCVNQVQSARKIQKTPPVLF